MSIKQNRIQNKPDPVWTNIFTLFRIYMPYCHTWLKIPLKILTRHVFSQRVIGYIRYVKKLSAASFKLLLINDFKIKTIFENPIAFFFSFLVKKSYRIHFTREKDNVCFGGFDAININISVVQTKMYTHTNYMTAIVRKHNLPITHYT